MRRVFIGSMALMLAGCGAQAGSDYLGDWSRQSEERRPQFNDKDAVSVIRDTLTIERNGDGFLLRKHRTRIEDGGKPFAYPEEKEPATLKDGQLQRAGGFEVYVIDKKTGHLIAPDREGDYVRAGAGDRK